jgi:PAS domain S-box-containing protein
VSGISTVYDLSGGIDILAWLFAGAAAASYARAEPAPNERGFRNDRSISWLPYVSLIGGYSVLVLAVFQGLGGALRTLVVAAVLLSSLVATRLLLTVRENVALLGAHHRDELSRSEARFFQIFNASPDPIAIVKTADGTVLEVNEALVRETGYAPQELLGHSVYDLDLWQSREEAGQWQNLCAQALEKGRVIDHELALRTKSGEARDTLASGELLQIGGETCLLSVIRDVTDSRRVEERLAREERLKTEFVAMAAHELKTPVTVMKGYAQFLLASGGTEKEAGRMLAAIDRGADRISRVVQDLLDVTRFQIGRFDLTLAELDLGELVGEIASEMVQRSPRHRLRFSANSRLGLRGDRERLEQVFANLVGNALKYSPQGGDIDVTLADSHGEIEIVVRDYGVGIPIERQAGMFERFYRAHAGTSDDFGGMGVGLFICQEIVTRHGGRVSFTSEAGKGSTFVVRLPGEEGRGDVGEGGDDHPGRGR